MSHGLITWIANGLFTSAKWKVISLMTATFTEKENKRASMSRANTETSTCRVACNTRNEILLIPCITLVEHCH